MFNFVQDAKSVFDFVMTFKNDKNRNTLLKYAIVAEAKFNNDLAKVICRSNAKEIAISSPGIFNEFSTLTADTLLMLGLPAYEILGDNKHPREEKIEELDKSSSKRSLFENKKPSELYEFYIRKCNLLKSLSTGGALTSSKVSLQSRCRNINYATKILIAKCYDK
jgi:hypothetical protein